ncbi:MAG: sugar ABC transporter substrate-binding protein [Cyanobacteria bacterium P01_D01_bin.123]
MTWNRRQFISLSAGLLLGACASGSRSPETSGDRIITFWTMQLKPTFDDYMTELIAEFEQQNPDTRIEWVDVPWGEMENKILTAIAANSGPDVVNLNPQFATKLAEKGALVDVETQLTPEQKAAYFPNIWKANRLGDVTFALPWYVATDITIYNRQIFEQAGLDPDNPPKTYEDLAEVAAQIKQNTGKYAFMLTMDGGQVLESMVQMGMTLVTPDGKAGFDNEAGRAAFQYWVDLFQQELLPREMLTAGHRRAIELYQAGELAMLLTGPQFLQQIEENAPAIAAVTDVSKQISGFAGAKSASVMNVAISEASAHVDEALDFAAFLTNDINQLEFSKIGNLLPSTIETAREPYFTAPEDIPTSNARIISAEQLPQSEVLVPPLAGLDRLRTIMYEELQLAMLDERSTREAIASAKNSWDSRA